VVLASIAASAACGPAAVACAPALAVGSSAAYDGVESLATGPLV